MKNIRRFATKTVAWGALSLSVTGGAGYKAYESASEQSRERETYIADTKVEINRYLDLLPELQTMVEARQATLRTQLDSMESRLGASCLAEMITPTLPSSFDDALTPNSCDEFTTEQLTDAHVFYRPVVTEYDAIGRLSLYLVDDPDDDRDAVDTLRYFSGDIPMVSTTEEVTLGPVASDENITKPYADDAVIVVPVGDSYSTSTISNPNTAPMAGYPIYWSIGFYAGLLSFVGSVGYSQRKRIFEHAVTKRQMMVENMRLKKQAREFLEIDDETLAQELEELKRNMN